MKRLEQLVALLGLVALFAIGSALADNGTRNPTPGKAGGLSCPTCTANAFTYYSGNKLAPSQLKQWQNGVSSADGVYTLHLGANTGPGLPTGNDASLFFDIYSGDAMGVSANSTGVHFYFNDALGAELVTAGWKLYKPLVFADGTTQSTAAGAAVSWSGASWQKSAGCIPAAGNFTVASQFLPSSPTTITGVRWFQASIATNNVKVCVWDITSSTRLTCDTLSPTSGAINTHIFASPQAVTNGHLLAVSVWDIGTPGTQYEVGHCGNLAPPFTLSGSCGSGFLTWGPNILLNCTAAGSGDALPTSGLSSTYFGIEPQYTVP